MYDKPIYLFWIGLFCLYQAVTAAPIQLELGTARVSEDGSITLPLYLDNKSPVAGLQFDLTDDSAVVVIDSVITGSRSAGFTAMTRNNRVLLFHDKGALLPAGSNSIAILLLSLKREISGTDTLRFLSDVIVANDSAAALDNVVTQSGILVYSPVTGLTEAGTHIPDQYRLYQNYPNPFNNDTVVRFDVPEAGQVRLGLYNVYGEKVRTLVRRYYYPGNYRVVLNGDLPSGIYFIRMQSGGFRSVVKCVLIK